MVYQDADGVPRQAMTDAESSTRGQEAHDSGEDEARNIKASLFTVIENIEAALANNAPEGLMTGFHDLDAMTSGLRGGEVMVIAARPSMGKTAFLLSIVANTCFRKVDPVPTAFFNLEASAEVMVQRMLCMQTGINMSKMRQGMLRRYSDIPKIVSVAAPLWIDDKPGLTIDEFQDRARRLKKKHDIQFIAIDNLQRLRAPIFWGGGSREVEVGEISSGIKDLARELDVPVIVLAQLSRKVESRGGGRPRVSDLRDSGAIEQDADYVGLLTRPGYYGDYEEDYDELRQQAVLILAKNRNGPIGDIPLKFLPETMNFSNSQYAGF